MKQSAPFLISILLQSVLLMGSSAALAYEQPRYKVIEKNDQFEIREYAPMVIAEVRTRAEFDDVGDETFRILFDYISGGNDKQEKISMTIPVNQQPVSENEAAINDSDGSLKSSLDDGLPEYRFSFVIPEKYLPHTLPLPDDDRITIRQVPATRMAAWRYSGTWSEKNYRKNEALLMEAIRARGLKTAGTPVYARYNSPFSLWFLRRNEVLIELTQ